jgi:ectoine hydroxylase-related dioxygenase (phytanoyl-CoA dioxygenase family)
MPAVGKGANNKYFKVLQYAAVNVRKGIDMTVTTKDKIDDRDWSVLTLGEQIKQLEVEGYLVLENLLSPELIAQLKKDTTLVDTKPVSYSDKQRSAPDFHFLSSTTTDLIAHPPTIAFLKELFGDEVVFMKSLMARSEPGHPGISLHADGQPYGSKIFGFDGSCPFLIRVLYYLDDLTPEVSPFLVVPRSHLSMHADANPYKRYECHPEQVMVTVKAGSAVLLNHRCFHGNYPNTGDRSRTLLAYGYRPGWAGPVAPVDERDENELSQLPEHVKPYFLSPNLRHWEFDGGDKPKDMKRQAPGINPSRWSRP